MGSLFVVDRHPVLRFCLCVMQRREAVRIENFNAIGSVESLDVGVLRWATRLDEVPRNVIGLGPCLYRVTLELSSVVAASRCRLAGAHFDRPVLCRHRRLLARASERAAVPRVVGIAQPLSVFAVPRIIARRIVELTEALAQAVVEVVHDLRYGADQRGDAAGRVVCPRRRRAGSKHLSNGTWVAPFFQSKFIPPRHTFLFAKNQTNFRTPARPSIRSIGRKKILFTLKQ